MQPVVFQKAILNAKEINIIASLINQYIGWLKNSNKAKLGGSRIIQP